ELGCAVDDRFPRSDRDFVVAISLSDIGQLVIKLDESEIALFSLLREFNAVWVRERAADVAELLTRTYAWSRAGTISGRLCDEGLMLSAFLTRSSALDAKLFASAITEFHQCARGLLGKGSA